MTPEEWTAVRLSLLVATTATLASLPFGIVFSFRWTGAALACAVMGFPLLVRAIRLSIEAVDVRLEAAAGTLGANPLWVFATVTLPLCLPGVIAGAILCFATSMGLLNMFEDVSLTSGASPTSGSVVYSVPSMVLLLVMCT